MKRGISSRNVLEDRLRDEPKEHLSAKQIGICSFFSRGFTCERDCDTAGVFGTLKQNFSFRASYVIEIYLDVTEKAIQMMYR